MQQQQFLWPKSSATILEFETFDKEKAIDNPV